MGWGDGGKPFKKSLELRKKISPLADITVDITRREYCRYDFYFLYVYVLGRKIGTLWERDTREETESQEKEIL